MAANTVKTAFSSMIFIDGFGSVMSTTMLLENGTVVAYVPVGQSNNRTVYAYRKLPDVPIDIGSIPSL